MAQNLPTHTTGSDMSGTVGASITTSTTDYATVKNTMQQTITSASARASSGRRVHDCGVNDVNPVTKADLGRLKQFVCISHSSNTLVMYPAMIWTGAFKNVAVASGTTDLNGAAITGVGTLSTAYRQNLVFHKNAFALAMVPLISPPGATSVSRQSYKGTSFDSSRPMTARTIGRTSASTASTASRRSIRASRSVCPAPKSE
jgi:hypothetical protein